VPLALGDVLGVPLRLGEVLGLAVLLPLGATPSTCTLSRAGPHALFSWLTNLMRWFADVAVNVTELLTQLMVVQPHPAGFV
jgi:hypothetical protein